MGLLDTFEMMNVPEQPFLSLSKYGITFSSLSLRKLHDANYVHTFIDRANRQFAVQPCTYDEAALELVKADAPNNERRFVRWGNRDLLRTLCRLANCDVSNGGTVRINGKYYEEENVIIFDLSCPVRQSS